MTVIAVIATMASLGSEVWVLAGLVLTVGAMTMSGGHDSDKAQ